MPKEPKEYIRHIQEECSYLLSVSDNLLFEDFINDETLKRAVVRSLEIIGEATKKSPQISKKNGIQFIGKIWQECETD